MKYCWILFVALVLISCNRSKNKISVEDTRTSGSVSLLVDESFAGVLDDQIEVFVDDYPDAKVTSVLGNEAKILPRFMGGKERVMVLSRMLKEGEMSYYRKNQIPVNTDRFAIDGIALITNRENLDTLVTAKEIFEKLRGIESGKKLVFDNANSSTVRYFMDSAGVKVLPSKGVYTLNTNNEVISFIGKNKDYIGVVGINWLIRNREISAADMAKVRIMSVKNLEGKKGGDNFYKPTQTNLIRGVYPFLRNVYLINAEGKNGLGTGFANWLSSPRAQLIVLKSGLGPHKMVSRNFNIK